VRSFLAGTAKVGFCATKGGEDERYRHIAAVLSRFGYRQLRRPDKGLILRYLERTTGYSRQQITRLVKRWGEGRGLRKNYRAPQNGWVRKFTDLCKQAGYVARRQVFTKTRPTGIAIGVRRAPKPDGRPGFIRIDSVHQGDQDGIKGVYHINAVDCVTQWELVATCEKIKTKNAIRSRRS